MTKRSPKGTSRPSAPVIRSTIEFARYVGLARTTVSRVLNGQPGLKSKTIARVQRAMDETGFTPNAYALHLKGKRTATIGICMESLLTATAVLKAAGLQTRLRERGFASLIEVLEPGGSQRVIRHFLSLRVDAVIFLGHFVEEEITLRLRELATHATPPLGHRPVGHRGRQHRGSRPSAGHARTNEPSAQAGPPLLRPPGHDGDNPLDSRPHGRHRGRPRGAGPDVERGHPLVGPIARAEKRL